MPNHKPILFVHNHAQADDKTSFALRLAPAEGGENLTTPFRCNPTIEDLAELAAKVRDGLKAKCQKSKPSVFVLQMLFIDVHPKPTRSDNILEAQLQGDLALAEDSEEYWRDCCRELLAALPVASAK